ncbi:MAG: membrane-bound lytic murein transglycosylase MltF [Halofilum sp. (in: g-proteobacteria)]
MRTRCRVIAVALALLLGACDRSETNEAQAPSRSLAEIRESGTLVVVTRNAPTTWYIGRDGVPTGPEYDLVESFAESIGVEVEYEIRETVTAVLDAIENGEGDLAAAGLTRTEDRRDRFRFGPAYQPVTQQVVCRRDHVQPESVEELIGLNIEVIADSSYVERLNALKADGHPDLEWTANSEVDTEQLLRRVWEREIDCTVADSTIIDINRRYYPELIAPFNLSGEQQLGWVMPQPRDDLAAAVEDWLAGFREDGQLADLRERYYGFFALFDYVDTAVYIRRIRERFPQYDDYFRAAAAKYDLPWLLLAAQGYQESHWNAAARSPTGVRGIMMLTLNTARAMGVENRLDARQSIFGGAKYLARMKQRFVPEVTEPDRTWLALAAYNVGRAHLHDAQTLARQQGLDPYRWGDIKKVLPLLADPEYYNDLKYGYARGTEPVRYVRRIREYQHVLANQIE